MFYIQCITKTNVIRQAAVKTWHLQRSKQWKADAFGVCTYANSEKQAVVELAQKIGKDKRIASTKLFVGK